MKSSGRLLVVGHDHAAGLGHLEGMFRQRGFDLEMITVVPDQTRAATRFPDVHRWDGVIVLGAPWPREKMAGWLPREREFIRTTLTAGLPVLGICFGAQLLAEVLGGGVRSLEQPRIGWSNVDGIGGGAYDGCWFQWHRDQLIAPSGATVLATSGDGCEGFTLGTALGLQFHPEMNSALLRSWLAAAPTALQWEHRRRLLVDTETRDCEGLHARVSELADSIIATIF